MSARRTASRKAKQASESEHAARLLEIVGSGWMAQAAYVAAKLQIADLLADGPRKNADLAAAMGVHAPSLHRLLRALTTIDICRERRDGSFEMTAMGSLLGTKAPASLHAWTIWSGANMWPVWGNLLYSVTTGKSARALLGRTEAFQHLEADPETAAVFNQALVELTRLELHGIVRAYDFSGLRRIVDVGGGYGELLVSILEANPSTHGVLFEMPHAIKGAKKHVEEAGVAARCAFIEGDFFDAVPEGADAYILKNVLHDWNDEDSVRILANCRRATASNATLLLIERVVPDRLETSTDHQSVVRSDLHMLIAFAARERTQAEFRELLEAAGFKLTRTLPVGMGLSLMVACPVA